MVKNILVTGAGGIGGVNFIRALRATKQDFVIIGTDFNPYYIQFGDLDFRYNVGNLDLLSLKAMVDKEWRWIYE